MHTPNVAKCNRIEQGNYATSHRANFRSVYDFGGPSWWTLDGGASENFLSRKLCTIQITMTINGII